MLESEKQFRMLFEFSPVGIAIIDNKGDVVEANRELAKIVGISIYDLKRGQFRKEKFIRSDGSVFLPEDFPGSVALREKKAVKEVEIGIIKEDAEPIWTEVSASPFESDPDYAIVITKDITHRKTLERKLAEAAHAESGTSFRSIFENSVMGISQAYPGGKLIRINQAYSEMYGYPDITSMLKDINDSTIRLYSNPSDRAKVLDILNKNGSMPPTEFELKRLDGQKFWALVAAKQVKDDNGKLLYLQAEHIDITGLKNAQKALKEIGEKYRLIVENSGLGIAYFSVDGKILMLNNLALKNLGGKTSDYIGKNLTEVYGNEASKVYIERLKSAAVSEDPMIYEDYVDMEGKPGWYRSTHSRILSQNGEVDGIQVIAENVTELKIAEDKLKASNVKYRNLSHHLEEILENERTTIAMNLHDDLGQKLTALDLDLAWTRGRIGVQSQSVKKKLDEMRLMINDIVESIKEISSFLRPSMLFDLGLLPAISSLVDKFKKSSGISCNLQSVTEEINIDDRISLIIYRVLQEALTNIARHSGASAAEIIISLTENRIEMIIKDNGKGIDDEKINSITSMGITGIKERVRAVNGKLQIKGGKNSGTRIMVSIPLYQTEND
jgi:two-component system, NarL family, sensor histidine kinase UhpB